METLPKIGIIDRYFSDKVEQRINRLSFFRRIIILIIAGIITLIFINKWFKVIDSFSSMIYYFFIISLISLFLKFLFFSIFLFSYFNLIKKRCHDFNKNGKFLAYTTVLSLALIPIIVVAIWFFYFIIWHNIFAELFHLNISYSSNNSFESALLFFSIGACILTINILIFLYILFHPGTIWSNNYGEAK